ncbi:MAG: hypothetical protein ACLGHE_01855 [Gammaproteobacteria bacterium]
MRSIILLPAALMALSVSVAHANPVCQELAIRYAQAPKSLKIGELDELKTCINVVQRELISSLGDASTPPGQVTIARPRAVPVLQDAE